MRAALCLVLWAGCSDPITEVVLHIDQVGINVGRDIDTIHINLGRDKLSPDSFYSVGVALCAALPTGGCHDLPLTATLIPGGSMPTDNVRAEVQAKLHGDGDNGVVRIRDIANFRFTRGQSLHLEIVLTPNCLDDPLHCADVESSCYQLGCYNPSPEPAGADLAVVLDLSAPRDLAGVDFKGVDMACAANCPAGYCGIDKNGCGVACTCDPNSFQTCGSAMMCVACGLDDQACCPSTPRCQSTNRACSSPDPGGTCVVCLPQASACNGSQPCCSGSVCDNGSCARCGQMTGDLCCAGATCDSGLTCVSGHCQPCGATGTPCCHNNPDNTCQPGNSCVNGPPPGGGSAAADHCQHCGDHSESCCQGACSNSPPDGCNISGTCETCGQVAGASCCGAGCAPGLDCALSGYCVTCGQTQQGPCCANNTCMSPLVCFQGMCVKSDMAPMPPQDMMTTSMMDMMAGACGNHNQPCCTTPSTPPCANPWLDCVGTGPSQSCRCGLNATQGHSCCQDESPNYCVALGLICDPFAGNTCDRGDMMGLAAMCIESGNGLEGDDCCFQGIDGFCAPNYACCHNAVCNSSMGGSVLQHRCYIP
jgi:hypothetical protein